MPKRKEAEVFATMGGKDCWHSYSLQVLAPGKFAVVVGKILSGKYALVNARMDDRATA